MDQHSCPHLAQSGRDLFSTALVPPPSRSATDMIPGLRPVDTVMFLFYLVLLALGFVDVVRNAFWFVPLGLSVVFAIFWFVARRQLGVAFSVRPEARQLVTTGFYARTVSYTHMTLPTILRV